MSALLNNEPGSGIEKTLAVSRRRKGDSRSLISCGEIESLFFNETTPASEGANAEVNAQKAGQHRAERRERVRRAARRAIVFGLSPARQGIFVEAAEGSPGKQVLGSGMPATNELNQPRLQMCEAVVEGVVVEPSFAKGDWCIRFRQ